MENRSIAKMVVLGIVTLGLYFIAWVVWTAAEMRKKGAEIPTTWLIIVPIANIYWYWMYYQAAEKVTNGGVNGTMMFIISLLIPYVPFLIVQSEFNKVGAGAMPGQATMPGQPQAARAAAMPQEAQPATPAPAPMAEPAAPVAPAQPTPAPAAPEAPTVNDVQPPQPPQQPPQVQ